MEVNLANISTLENIMLKDSGFLGAEKETVRSVFSEVLKTGQWRFLYQL